jgi:hypothetical protein
VPASPQPRPTVAPTPLTTPSTPAPSPAPSPGPTLTSTIPAGVSVVYWARWTSGDDYTIHAVDWSGHARGELTLAPTPTVKGGMGPPSRVEQSPDGTELLVDDDIYAEDGHWLGHLPVVAGQTRSVAWADDGRHLCLVADTRNAGAGTAPSITMVSSDGTVSTVSPLPTLENSNDWWRVDLCSVQAGQALIDENTDKHDRVVRLALDGKVISDSRTCTQPCGGDGVLYSHDLRYSAQRVDDTHILVKDAASGQSRRVSAAGLPLTFTWDGAAVLIELDSPSSSQGIPETVPGLRLVDWRSGRTLWSQANAGTNDAFWMPEPSGAAIAIGFDDYHPNTGVFPSGPLHLDLVRTGPTSHRQRVVDDFTDMFGFVSF